MSRADIRHGQQEQRAMTRKDYVLIAAQVLAVRDSYAPNRDANLRRACDDMARRFADTLAQDNPRFDRERFLTACGVQS